ncbi:TPA: 50S ribosomal protein L15 [Candidatus Woesearchaeota archaeon]|nr:50S ribosomal protein L15P [archaeon GW2011_AR15]AJS11589.1 50S ribosomal protein L15P [uncultured archaeon]AJS11869.1 50S ribosomal protein L15P [uncultured archaeon]MBS3103843.1 uL15 family ribosomal protein [Candidatus Woesearchaeota archaeon]HIH40831.1 50S ribosomal protein L15 [Candidatus Woesearchaeota archaeon]
MQTKRTKRSRIRAAKPTGGHGHKKKNRGAGHRGGRGKSGSGKRGDFKIMKVTKGEKVLGKHGFTSLKKHIKAMNLSILQTEIESFVKRGEASKNKDAYEIDLSKLGYRKLLSKGDVSLKFHITVDSATENAVARVEEAGGKVTLLASSEEPEKADKE